MTIDGYNYWGEGNLAGQVSNFGAEHGWVVSLYTPAGGRFYMTPMGARMLAALLRLNADVVEAARRRSERDAERRRRCCK